MTNPKRPDVVASLLGNGEAQTDGT